MNSIQALFAGFGDAAAMLPAAGIFAAWAVASGAVGTAAAWLGLIAGASAVVVATKLAFIGWDIGWPAIDFTGVSGHAMLAAALMPTIFRYAARDAAPWLRRLSTGCGILLALLAGAARVAVGAHSWSEVIAGWLLGGAVALAAAVLLPRPARPRVSPRWLPVALILVLAGAQGHAAPTQAWITDLALALSGHDRPFERNPAGRLALAVPDAAPAATARHGG